MRCSEFRDGIATLAEDGTDARAEAHVAQCAACAGRLAQLRRIVAASNAGYWTTPPDLALRARAMMGARPRLVARLLGNGLANSGARRADVRDFALHVGVEDFSIRLHYVPNQEGWEVLGRAPTSDWTVAYRGGTLPCGPSGRFRLLSPDLDGTAFVLCKEAVEIEVPSARELTDDDV